MPPTDEQIAALLSNQQSIIQELTETSTVVRRHIEEQRSINRRMDRLANDLETRMRQTEQEVVHIKAKLVKNPVDHDDFDRLEEKVDSIGIKVAGWSGGIAALVTAGGFIFRALFS